MFVAISARLKLPFRNKSGRSRAPQVSNCGRHGAPGVQHGVLDHSGAQGSRAAARRHTSPPPCLLRHRPVRLTVSKQNCLPSVSFDLFQNRNELLTAIPKANAQFLFQRPERNPAVRPLPIQKEFKRVIRVLNDLQSMKGMLDRVFSSSAHRLT